MQDARREALAARLHKERMQLWDQDLNRVTTYLDGIGVVAALLLGFAFSVYTGAADGITHLKSDNFNTASHNEDWKSGLFYVSGVVATGAFTYVIAIGQLTTILGPLLALKGPDGSMERALRKMKDERGALLGMFCAGLVGFFFQLLSLTFLQISLRWIQVLCTGVFTCVFVAVATRGTKMLKSFSYEAAPLRRIVKSSQSMRHEYHVGESATKATSGDLNAIDYLSTKPSSAPPSPPARQASHDSRGSGNSRGDRGGQISAAINSPPYEAY